MSRESDDFLPVISDIVRICNKKYECKFNVMYCDDMETYIGLKKNLSDWSFCEASEHPYAKILTGDILTSFLGCAKWIGTRGKTIYPICLNAEVHLIVHIEQTDGVPISRSFPAFDVGLQEFTTLPRRDRH